MGCLVVHLVGLVVFAVCRGVSAFVAFRILGIRDRSLVLELLALSQRVNQFACLGLLVLLVGGIRAGAQSGVLTKTWVLAIGEMVPEGSADLSGDALAATLDSRRPDRLAAIGFGGLIVVIALMVFKPV